MALQDTLSSRDAISQNAHRVASGQQQHAPNTIMPINHELANYGTSENSQNNVRVTIIPGLMQSPQTVVSTRTHMTNLQVTPAPISPESTQSVHSMVLQNPKEEHCQREQERRIRREIANSNERRRMQSINAGFKSLKSILPHTEGEKLSKAAILQQTSDYIQQLESDKARLIHQNDKLRKAFTDCKCNPSKNRTLADIFEKDEGIGSPAEEDFDDMQRGMTEIKQQLDKERRLRMMLEEQVRSMESRIYTEGLHTVASVGIKDTSQSAARPSSKEEFEEKLQPCARTLLPPLAPLSLPKLEVKYETQTQPSLKDASLPSTSTIFLEKDNSCTQVDGNAPIYSESIDVTDGAKITVSSPQSEHLVTVFSHSNKSNQPLKKRAIEILEVHQTMSDYGCDVNMEQPKAKVAKMAIDRSAIEKTSVMMSTADPSVLDASSLTPAVKVVPLPNEAPVTISTHQPTMPLPALALSLPEPKVHFPPLSSSSGIHGLPKSLYKTMLPQCSMPTDVMTSSQHSAVSMAQNVERHMGAISSKVDNTPTPPHQAPIELLTFVNRNPSQEGNQQSNAIPGPVYFTVNGITYVQQDSDKFVPLPQQFQHPQYIVAPHLNNCNGTAVGTNGLPQNGAGMQLVPQSVIQPQPLHSKVSPAIVTYQQTPISQPATAHNALQASQPFTVVQNSTAQYTLQSNAAKHLQNQHTLLCYSQPEITLNQLNAVPNLAPPKSLHQPVMSVPMGPSVGANGGSESPYIIPHIHENALPSKVNSFINPAALRCQNSSNAADSSSTASASGTEEEEIPSKGNTETRNSHCSGLTMSKVPKTLSVGAGRSPVKSVLSESSGVAAYEIATESVATAETATALSDGVDSDKSPIAKTLSVLTNVSSSPPVMRRMASMQSRGNLETIVQAIDHLEQQERRNSQDQPEIGN